MDPSNKRRLLWSVDSLQLSTESWNIFVNITRRGENIVNIFLHICPENICSQYFECKQRSSALNKLASSSLRWASSLSLLSWLRANLVWQFKSIGTNEERGDLGGTVKKMSSSWTTPSPSQRPIEPPKEASTLKLDWFVILWVFTSARLKGV